MVSREERPRAGDVIVAVDFGTSRTALCWTLHGRAEEDIQVETLEVFSGSRDVKVPTTVLVDHQRGIAFGYEAERLYSEEAADHPEWMLFKWFKLALHKPIVDDPLVYAVDGRQLPLSSVLHASLECVAAVGVNILRSKGILVGSQGAQDVFWVLTLPAIWTDHAKGVMRKACFRAGLIPSVESSRLLLALEPECAAVASQLESSARHLWSEGNSFLIVDCGGGTVDITAHAVTDTCPLKLRELIPPDGGPYGGIQVDAHFHGFITALFGEDNLATLKRVDPAEFINLCKAWEDQKQSFVFDDGPGSWVYLRVGGPLQAMGLFHAFDSIIGTWNQFHPHMPITKKGSAVLGLSHALVTSFFMGPVEDIVSTVERVIRQGGRNLSMLNFIVMAGGFSRCALLQRELQSRLRYLNVPVIVGNRPDLLIVKGAAAFGARPMDVLESRKSKYTFGVGTTRLFDKKNPLHKKNKSKAYKAADGDKRIQVFSVHGTIGEDVVSGERTPVQKYFPLTDKQDAVTIKVLVSKSADVAFVDEKGVSVLASVDVNLDMSAPYERRGVGIQFSFGTSEVMCYLSDWQGREVSRLQPNFSIV